MESPQELSAMERLACELHIENGEYEAAIELLNKVIASDHMRHRAR